MKTIDAPNVREYLTQAFSSSLDETWDIGRDLSLNSGYFIQESSLDREYSAAARSVLGDIRGQVEEQIDLSPIPNAKFKHADELYQYLDRFKDHLKNEKERLERSFDAYSKQAKRNPRLIDTPPEPIIKAISLTSKYISALETALGMPEFQNTSAVGLSNTTLFIDSMLSKLCHSIRVLKAKRHCDQGSPRASFDINDEYDVQDYAYAVFQMHFDDVRKEEPLPSFGPNKTRCDIFLASHGIFIEVKTTLKKTEKQIFTEFQSDIPCYLNGSECKKLILFVHDPSSAISNQKQFDALKSITVNGKSVEAIVFSR